LTGSGLKYESALAVISEALHEDISGRSGAELGGQIMGLRVAEVRHFIEQPAGVMQ